MHNITNGFVIYDLLNENPKLFEAHFKFYQEDLTQQFYVTLIVMCVLNSLALMFLINLITFHIELKYKGLTTYEFLRMKDNITRESKIVVKINKDNAKRQELE